MLTERESWQFEKFVMKHAHYFHTEEDALKVLKQRNMHAWSVEEINRRFRDLQQECTAANSLTALNDWFEHLNDYYVQHMNGADAGKAAQAYLNHVRALRLWFTHFDHWYDTYKKELGHDDNKDEGDDIESQFPF